MKIARVLVLLTISTIVIGSIGCNEMMDMTKPVVTPEPEVPEPLSYEDASNKAYNIITRTGEAMENRTNEWLSVFFEEHGLHQLPSDEDLKSHLEEIKVIVFEETGVTWEESIDLVELFLEDTFLAEQASRGSKIINIGAVQMYLTIAFMNPTHTKEELIEEIRSMINTDGLGEFGLQMFIMVYELFRPVPTIYDHLPGLTSADTIADTEVPEKLPEEVVEPLTEEEAHNKALRIARETIGFMELNEGVPQYRFGESISEGAEKILIENTGLTWQQLRDYTLGCMRERGETEHIEESRRFIAYIDVLVNYLELAFLHPPADGDERFIGLLLIDRCGKREVFVDAFAVIEKYYPPDHVDDLRENWNEFLRELDGEEEEGAEDQGEEIAPGEE